MRDAIHKPLEGTEVELTDLMLTDAARSFLQAMAIATKYIPDDEMPAFCEGINGVLKSSKGTPQ